MAIKYQDENGNWVSEEQTAIETSILDIAGNFESENVEGALRELAEKTANAEVPAELEAQVKANTTNIKKIQQQIQNSTGGGASSEELEALDTRVTSLETDMSKAKEDIAYLLENGGGGGGSVVPTIKSDFKDCTIDKGTDVVIPIFFTSPNMGDATAYITVNNIQVDTAAVKQGANNIRVKAKYLINTDNNVGIYVKDRAGMVTNRLNWMIIAGGIDLTSTFDYEVDYGITDTIRIPYTIDTGVSGTITTYLTIDGNTTEYTSVNGNNFIDLLGSDLGLGTHAVELYSTVDKYTSNKLTFNLVIISTTELYLSSTFVSGSEFTYGSLISVNYRLSKQSTEEFNVYLKIDDKTVKSVVATVGNYFWTIQNIEVGEHKLTIQVVSMDHSEVKELNLQIVISKGVYTPVEEYKLGLICDLNAVGKNNTDTIVTQEKQWTDDSGNGHHGKLVNFNFGTNGFVNDQLVCDNDAYVVIEWSPWKQNAITGSTIDLIYTPINSGVEDCRVIDYTTITDDLSTDAIKPFKGVFADILQAIGASASSGSSASKVNLDDENGRIHLTWVLDRDNKFLKTYIDGVLCRIMFLTDSGTGTNKFYEDFSHDAYIYLNSTKGKNCGTYNIERFRVYDHALTSEQVLQNELASITDLDKQEQLYNFNYHNTTLPKMYLNGDITNMTAYQTVPMSIEYISPDEERYGQSFNTGIQNNPVKIQGTSSLQYVRKNYTIYLKDEYGADMYYNPYGAGSVADYVFCLKADYVESSHANNTGCAKFVNDCLYDTKTPMQLDNENCRTAINGFPIEVYMNGEYLGIYNFNHDRYSYQSYGYDYKRYPNLLVYEINSNSNTSAGAFYRYGDNEESSAGVTELAYYKRDFNLIYGNRTADSDTYSEIKTLVEWVSVAEQDLFRETISEHFNTEYLFRYFLMVLLIGAVDSLGKNLKIMTIDGRVWYPTFYDMDTVLGIDNTGYLTIPPDVEIESGSYNTSNSNLWNKVWNFFRQELKDEWAAMRQGRFTLDNLMDYIYNQQISVIPAKYYNDDAEVKYLQFGSLYTYCCHGNKEHQIRRWLRERIAYVDSMLGYFTSQEDQVTVRMNKTGYVSFDITTYIPLYFSVKWSNASGGTQTFKMARGETKSFYYTSTTSTDQEVIIYHAQYIKALDNLSNLNPSSCILANARKLTNVEIHSTELYNINVTNNTFLRTINLEGCSTLGTVTATGSSLDLSNCKYLRYCNVYNTALTEVQLNTSGGSLIEIYYPSTLQSLTLIKQRLLETIGLPYGTNGREVPTALYTVNIQECPNIKYLNTSDDPTINTSFASIYYCNNLTLRNSLDLAELNFDGFHRLKNVTIENMFNLTSVGFNNLLPVGNTSTLKYVGFSNCPLLEEIELNCTSNDYEISFDTNSVLNFGGLSALKTISSNCVIKGLDTIVLPLRLENMFFTTEYGEGFSEIKNLWSSAVCNVNINGSTVECLHVIEGYEGIDFANMHLINIDLGGLVNIKDAINFSLYPTTVNPNFNKNRDGVTHPYLQPQGILDLSNYTESLAKFFDGVDLRKLQLVCTNPLPQKDLSYCFYNSTFDRDTQISAILDNLDTVNNMEYCFYKTSVKDVSVLNTINFLAGTSLAYCFAECKNISKLENLTLSGNIGNASYMFSGSGISTINNVSTSCGNIVGMFSNCDNLITVTNFDANGTTSYESLFEGCLGMSVAPVTVIPNTITNIKNMYKNCDGLVSIDDFVLHRNITEATGFVEGCNNLINANNVTISGPFYNDIFRGLTSLKYVNNLLINYVGRSMTFANMFDGCTNLIEMSFHNDSYVKDVISMDYMFRGTSMKTVDFSNVNFEKIVSYKYMFADCLMEEFSFTVPKTITSIQGMLSNCRNLKTLKNFTISHNVTVTDWLLDTPVENLINCSFYNQNTSFKNNVTLKKIEGFNYTGNNLANYFEGCSNLQSAELKIGSVTTKANNLFASCPLLNTVEFNTESNLSNITTISDMFNGDNSLTTIKNLKITNSTTIANNTTLSGCPINNTDGFYINSNLAVQMFRMGTESKISQFTDFEIGNSCDNLSEAFKDYPLLVKDIYLPSHMANVSYAFSNCVSMINIVSNWTNPYDRNNDDVLDNDVITDGCYAGSNNIKYINDELYMNEYGELTAMQYIPQEWGGNASYADNQTVFDVKITTDNLVYSMVGVVGDHKTNWGDGTEDMNISHEYSKPGTYTIVTENIETFAQGTVLDTAISSSIVKFRALNKSQTNGSHLFDGWTNLLKVNKLTNTFNSYDYMFNNCSKLVDVDLSGCTLSQTVTTMAYMCNGCSKFTKTPISIIPDTCTNISYLFANSGIIDISGITFGSGISDFTSWVSPKMVTANNVTVKCSQLLFKGNATLVSIDGFTVSSNIRNISSWFEGCTKLSEDFDIPLHIIDCSNTFKGCVSMAHVHSNWNKTYNNTIIHTNCYAGCNGITHIDDKNVIAYDGDLGLDYIPLDWGGNGFIKDCTSIYELNITDEFVNTKLKPIDNPNLLALDSSVAKVNWGDGSPVELLCVNNKITTHTYTTTGTYFVKAHASMGHGYGTNTTFAGALSKLLQVTKYEKGRINNLLQYACSGAYNMTYADFSNLAYEKGVTKFKLGAMFLNCKKLKTVIIPSDWMVEECSHMCSNCSSLESVDFLKDWDISNCTSTQNTFANCSSLTSLDLSKWNLQNMESFNGMFYGCTNLVSVKMSKDTPNLRYTMQMFHSCKALVEAPELDTSKVVHFGGNNLGMFQSCYALTSVPVYDFSSAIKVSRMFENCRSLRSFKCINCSSNIQYYNDGYNDWSSMFIDCHELTSIEGLNFEGLDYTNNYKGQPTASGTVAYNCQKLTTFTVKEGTKIKVIDTSDRQYLGFNLHACNALSKESLLNIINALEDYNGDSVRTLDITPTNIAKLSESDIQIVTSKNWTLI